jgi:hypothetical protein
MELDNFIIGKNRGEERRVGQKKATGACQKKNRATAAKHRVKESN